MLNEVRYSEFEQTGRTVEEIGLQYLMKLYVNHRPVLGIGRAQIEVRPCDPW